MTIFEFLIKHKNENPISFHMPGHKGNKYLREFGYGEFLDDILACDITEIQGADNLFQPDSIIKNTMIDYEALYNAKYTRLLVNGSSCGLLASILSTVKPSEKLIMARNSHKSVFNGVSLGCIKPVYVGPEYLEEYGILGEISVELLKEKINSNPDAKAIILPSPNYYGICSDIKEISKIAHEKGMVLIIDQAHGAHLKFYDGNKAAENLGADIVINSIHKTLFSFTESAVINICTNKVDVSELDDKIQMIESTSPSYLLMASLDINGRILKDHRHELIHSWKKNIKYFWEAAKEIEGLDVMKHRLLDETKLNLDMSRLGLTGRMLENELIKRNIYPELVSGNIVMCMTGIGNEKKDYTKLISALKDISESNNIIDVIKNSSIKAFNLRLEKIPNEKKRVNLDLAEGQIVAEGITPYPPGIPIACPGEVLDKIVIDYVKNLKEEGHKVIGVNEKGEIAVGI